MFLLHNNKDWFHREWVGGGGKWGAEGGFKATIQAQTPMLCLQYVTN